MDNKEAIYYLQYLRHDVHANSPYDAAILTAINALSETKPPKSNADRIRQMTDEELAVFMVAQAIMGAMATNGIGDDEARKATREIMKSGESNADIEETIEWLRKEADEDATERTY